MHFPFLSSNKLTNSLNNYHNIHSHLFLPLRHLASKVGVDNGGNEDPTTSDLCSKNELLDVKKDQKITLEKDETTAEATIIQYKDICNITNLELGLKRTKSGASAGLDGEVKANYTTGKLEKLAEELKSHTFKASPIKKVWIPKPDGGKRPLGISSQKDKIVQATILNLFEPLVEKTFLESSMGFRPNRGSHNALHRIKRRWQNVTWLINIDISKYFDTINHSRLLELTKPFCDQATLELIGKLLKANYVDISNISNVVERRAMGTPQGSLISPLLANIYLHELDKFVEHELLLKWNAGDERKYVKGYQTRKRLTTEQLKLIDQIGIEGLAEAAQAHKHNMWVKAGPGARDQSDPDFKRLHYIRFADDFILGYTGPKEDAVQIKTDITNFVNANLQLKVNESKSGIYHSSDKNILFLGFYIKYLPPKQTLDSSKLEQDVKQTKMVAINQAQLRIPVPRILSRLTDRGYAVKRKNGTYRATSVRKFCSFEDKLIVNQFSSVIRGIVNYYRPANQYSDLWPIVALLRKSCALTLADKHKLKTAAKAYKKFGPNLKITDPLNPKDVTTLFYPDTLKTTNNFNLGKFWMNLSLVDNDPIQGSYKSNVKTSAVCQFPGCKTTEGLQEHHINELRNLKKKGLHPYLKSLIAKKRKTVTLCEVHHKLQHSKTGKTKVGWHTEGS